MAHTSRVPVALTIAGSDSGGGAGVQADLKAFAALGVHGVSAITALTAQNTVGVFGILEIEPEFVGRQIDVVVDDIGVDATKTGMLASPQIAEAVAERVRRHHLRPLVVDPVLVASSGEALHRSGLVEALRGALLPLTTVVTPNPAEAAVLSGRPVTTWKEIREAARAIRALGPEFVVVTGGDLPDASWSVDVLFDGVEFHELRAPRIATPHTHGTGCTFASAIAAGLALGLSVPSAVGRAKELATEALRHALPIGRGRGPVNGMAWLYEQAGLLPERDTYDPRAG